MLKKRTEHTQPSFIALKLFPLPPTCYGLHSYFRMHLKIWPQTLFPTHLANTLFRAATQLIALSEEVLRGVLLIVLAGNDIIKSDFTHTKRTTFLLK